MRLQQKNDEAALPVLRVAERTRSPKRASKNSSWPTCCEPETLAPHSKKSPFLEKKGLGIGFDPSENFFIEGKRHDPDPSE